MPLPPPDYRPPYLCVFIQLFPPVLCPFLGEGLTIELSEIFATGELSAEDMDNIMYVMHRAYFQYREQKREQEKNLGATL